MGPRATRPPDPWAWGRPRPLLILAQVALLFPLAHLTDVRLPLLLLRLEEPLVDVWTQRLTDDIVLLEHFERLVQIARQFLAAVVTPLAEAHLEDVLVHRVRRYEPLRHAVEPGCELHREGRVGVGGRVGPAGLAAGAGAAAVRGPDG